MMNAEDVVTLPCSACQRPVVLEREAALLIQQLRAPTLCETCIAEAEAAEAVERQHERNRERREHELRRDARRHQLSTVPANYRRELSSLDLDDDNRAAIRAAVAWRDGEQRGLVLTGPVGSGKSTIAAAACWEAQLRHPPEAGVIPPLWSSVPIMLGKLLASFSQTERATALRAITGTQAIVLDDLDKLNATDWAATQLFAAIEGRVIEGAQLLVTTNLTLDELDARLGGEFGTAIASRLVGYCRVVRVAGRDRRMPA